MVGIEESTDVRAEGWVSWTAQVQTVVCHRALALTLLPNWLRSQTWLEPHAVCDLCFRCKEQHLIKKDAFWTNANRRLSYLNNLALSLWLKHSFGLKIPDCCSPIFWDWRAAFYNQGPVSRMEFVMNPLNVVLLVGILLLQTSGRKQARTVPISL